MSNNLSSKNVVLVGAGTMAMDYARVLKRMGVNFTVVGRSLEGTKKFKKKTGVVAIPNGVAGWQGKENNCAEYGIIAVSFEELATTAIKLMDTGIRKILLEKPAGLTAIEIKEICQIAKETGTKIFLHFW